VTNNATAVNDSALSFARSTVAVGSGDSIPEGITTTDFNNDGLADLAITDTRNNSNRVYIYLGNGSGGFTAGGTQATGLSPTSITTNDFNGDGKSDVAIANYADNTISILPGVGNGNLLADPNPLWAGNTVDAVIGGGGHIHQRQAISTHHR
jgi:hypothetical protein